MIKANELPIIPRVRFINPFLLDLRYLVHMILPRVITDIVPHPILYIPFPFGFLLLSRCITPRWDVLLSEWQGFHYIVLNRDIFVWGQDGPTFRLACEVV